MWNNYGNSYQIVNVPFQQFYPNFCSLVQFYPVTAKMGSDGIAFFVSGKPHELQKQIKNSPVRSHQPTLSIEQEIDGSTHKVQRKEKEKDRNMISNSLKVFRKYASDSSKIKDSVIQSIIQSKGLDYTPQDFCRDLDRKIQKEKNYLGIKFLNSLLSKKQKNSNFAITFRILLSYYYKKGVYPTVLTSYKILNNAKKRQLIGIRKIAHNLFN